MEGGLEICIAARNYQLQGDIEQAVDRYSRTHKTVEWEDDCSIRLIIMISNSPIT